MATYRLDVAYDGSEFHGFARQPAVRTVQGDIETALATLIGPVQTVGAGRTDAGVHARHQVMSFTTDPIEDLGRCLRSLNGILAPEISIDSLQPVDDAFDARFSATWRSYRYFILNRPWADPLLRHRVWHVSEPLDVDAMTNAADHLLGEHDFASFCRAVEGGTTVRKVLSVQWGRDDELTYFEIRAAAFCQQMVRSLVAFLVDVGRGRLPADSIRGVLAARDRSTSRGVAPPHGLILWDVGY